MRHISALLVLAFLVGCVFSAGNLVNTLVERNIDLTSQFARHTISISVENKGSSNANEYELTLQNAHQNSRLAFLKVTESGSELKVAGQKGALVESYTTYKVTFAQPLEAGKSTKLTVTLVLAQAQKPFPSQINQADQQFVLYRDNHLFFSPYTTTSQKTTVKTPTTTIEDYTEKKPTKLTGSTLTFGSYSDIAPFTDSELKVHFENNSPFITVTKLEKIVEISHWGNVAVEQHFDIRHDGAQLKGSFSRFDFQRNPAGSPSAVLQLVEVLPQDASDVYYRDDIGNISTSTFRSTSKGLEFYIIPRFPLFGGWKNNFYTGYNLPLKDHLNTDASDSSLFVLNSTFSVDIAEVFVEHLVLRVILPEGAKDARVVAPFAVDTQSTDKHFTYLDTTGRTVLVIEKRNVIKEHNQYFQIYYNYSRLSMLHEPLLVAGAVFAFLLAVIVYMRFEISIKKTGNTEADLKATKTINTFKESIGKFEKEYKTLQNAYKNITDSGAYKQDRARNVSQYLNKHLQDASNLANALTKNHPNLADRLQELVTYQYDRVRAALDLQDLEMEFKAGGSKGKAKYDKEREELQRKYDDAADSAESILAELTNYI